MKSDNVLTKSATVSYRDQLGTIDERGKRIWIFPKRPKGSLYTYRSILAGILLTLLLIGPWLRYQGEPFMLFNIPERRFILFGQLFWPQDFHLFVWSLISIFVFVILFTVIFGRVFCGWVCPQTIFLEFVFRQIEYLIEGSAQQQRKLARQEWDFEKIWKKSLKHLLFFTISLIIIHTFLTYIIGTDTLLTMIQQGPLTHIKVFTAVVLFSAVFYFIYSFFREQVCTLVCPYGRLQGALLDNKSIVVAYDYKRGEPRGRRTKSKQDDVSRRGDCIDCFACVTVCPTGIDIRNGTQLECINCTACIDACNAVMKRLKLPKGLIRHTSEENIAQGTTHIFNARSIAYTVFLTILLVIAFVMFSMRTEVETTVLRVPGTMFQEYGPDSFSNVYKAQLVNKTRKTQNLQMKLNSEAAELIVIGDPILLESGKMTEVNFLIVMPKKQLQSSSVKVEIGVYESDRQISTTQTNFIGPNSLDH